jgi:CubicO group peptidase (beta-lactamase class C family)
MTSLTAARQAVEQGVVAGVVVAVADRDQVLWETQAGMRDIDAGEPMASDTLFWVASMSKPVTAAAAMVLVDAGQLDLDAPVSAFLGADFEPGTPQGAMTARQCLSHTSGLPFASAAELRHRGGVERFSGSKFAHYRETNDDSVYDELPLAVAVASYAVEPLLSAPGTRFHYSNAGINLVGRIIECISGEVFSDFVDRQLLAPLGMASTSLWPSREQLQQLAKSYSSSEPPRRNGLVEVPFPQLTAPYHDRSRGAAPSGGYFSTVADCVRFGSECSYQHAPQLRAAVP